MRRALAQSLQRVLAGAAVGGPPRLGAAVPVRRDAVIRAWDAFEDLIRGLLAPGPVSVCGVAQVRLLLTDGYGPLYHPDASDDLRLRVQRALDALDPFYDM